MKPGRKRAVVAAGISLACLLSVTLATETTHADPPRAAGPAASGIHERGHYPQDLLVAPEPDAEGSGGHAPRPVPIFGGGDAPTLTPDPAEPWSFPDFEIPWLRELLRFFGGLGYVVLAAAVLLLAALLVWLLLRFRRPIRKEELAAAKPRGPVVEEVSIDPLLVAPELGHDELARQGRYREAMHALLVLALLATGWVPEGRGRGLTAREIVGGYARPTPPREPLAELLRLVERIWFGGREATRETYEDARATFERFVAPTGAP